MKEHYEKTHAETISVESSPAVTVEAEIVNHEPQGASSDEFSSIMEG
jgi:hypothetical protein